MTGSEREQIKAEIRELKALCSQVAGQSDPRSQWLHDLISSNIALRRERLEAARTDGASRPAQPAGHFPLLLPWLGRWAIVKAAISEFSYRKRGTV